MGAGNSVIECALMGIQQTHKPKKASRWRSILKHACQGRNRAQTSVSHSALSPFFRSSAGSWSAGLLGLSKRPGGRLETTADSRLGPSFDHRSRRVLSVDPDMGLAKDIYLRY